jgi:hypothetical protein
MSGTAAQALQAALAPKTGMQRIPLTLDSYQHQSVPLSSRLLLNMHAEQAPPPGQGMARVDALLLPTPGLVPAPVLGDGLGAGPVHVMNDTRPGIIYCVSGTHLYLLNFGSVGPWVSTDLGDVGTPVPLFGEENTFYTIAVGATAVVVCSPPNAFISQFNTPVQQITTTWPAGGASSVAYLDGYYVFTNQLDPTEFFISQIQDPTMFDALDFASLDAFPDNTLKVEAMGADLWFAGTAGWEIWYDAGNADFPFRRRPNGIIKRPIGRMKSIAQGNEQLFWWSFDNRVYATAGYQEQRISTHAIERVIADAYEVTIAQSYCYDHLGHIFYCLNLPDTTLAYDTVTKVWHNRSSSADGNGPWRPSCAAQTVGVPFLGDSGTPGRLLMADRTVSTDAGVAVRRQVVLPPLYAGTRRGFCARLEVEMEVGGTNSPGDILLEWSDDGGITYTGSRAMNAGTTTQTRKRVYTTRLGSFRNRVFRLTAQHAMSVYAIDCDIVVGNS